jgi:hypothetical protein
LISATSFAISGDFVDLLSKYSGVAIGRTSTQPLLLLVKEQLIEQKAVMLFAAFVSKDDVSSVVCQTVNAWSGI